MTHFVIFHKEVFRKSFKIQERINITIDNDQLWSIEFQTRRNILIHERKV